MSGANKVLQASPLAIVNFIRFRIVSMNKLKIIFAVSTLLLITSCGQAPSKLEETCVSDTCSEKDLNAPISGTTEDSSLPSSVNPKINYRMPAYTSSWGISKKLYDKTVQYYDDHYSNIPNKAFVTIVDFSLSSTKKRLFLFDLEKGTLEKHLVSHGAGSDPDNDTFATLFSNTPDSKKSSLGFYLTLSTYIGGHGYSLKIRGLQSSNSNAEARAIVMHPADYVSEKDNHAGRSWGCPALDPQISKSLIDKIRSGSLILLDK